MTNAFLDGFSDELMKLAIADITPEKEDDNFPWDAGSKARGIEKAQKEPSRVLTGHLGKSGPAGKSSTDEPYRRGQEQTGDY